MTYAMKLVTTEAMAHPTEDDLWQALLDRDPAYLGRIYYGVITTGIYCLPTCSARKPKRENVRFFETAAQARQAGLRACKRCKPEDYEQTADARSLVERVCRLMEIAEGPLTQADVAAHVGVSVTSLHAAFRDTLGITPKAYADAIREGRLRDNISAAPSVTAALYDAGYGSSGRFYAAAKSVLGMTPRKRRQFGQGETIRFSIGPCSLGHLLVAATKKGICSITLGDDPDALLALFEEEFVGAELIGGDPAFEAMVAQVVGAIDRPGQSPDLPLDIQGTAFQKQVWAALMAIKPGETASYSEIARRIGKPKATRAVAGACAANHLAVIIPCHRVVRTDGSLTGYRWGIERKAKLLAKEAQS